jgi:hypothetical protein
MKLVFISALLSLTAMLQTQTSTQVDSDLVILKFSWSKHSIGSGLIRPVEADPAPGPIVITRDPIRDPNYQRPAASPHERSAELLILEREAAGSNTRPSHFYVYRIQFKNAGTKPIKSFVWAFKDPDEMPDSQGRQFQCAVKTKPNEKKSLEVLSTQAPSRVVDASKAGDKAEDNLTAEINEIEYSDGSTWQRLGWNSSILSQDTRPKLDNGKCVKL